MVFIAAARQRAIGIMTPSFFHGKESRKLGTRTADKKKLLL
jgi:hypothetical protein